MLVTCIHGAYQQMFNYSYGVAKETYTACMYYFVCEEYKVTPLEIISWKLILKKVHMSKIYSTSWIVIDPWLNDILAIYRPLNIP